MVIWITGKASAGKTTLANKLKNEIGSNAVILDADNVRKIFGRFVTYYKYTNKDRYLHQQNMAIIAVILEEQGYLPIIACVSPERKVRKEFCRYFKEVKLYYVTGGFLWEGTTYEEPDEEELAEIIHGNEILDLIKAN